MENPWIGSVILNEDFTLAREFERFVRGWENLVSPLKSYRVCWSNYEQPDLSDIWYYFSRGYRWQRKNDVMSLDVERDRNKRAEWRQSISTFTHHGTLLNFRLTAEREEYECCKYFSYMWTELRDWREFDQLEITHFIFNKIQFAVKWNEI